MGIEFDVPVSIVSKYYKNRIQIYEKARLLSKNKNDGFFNKRQLKLCKRVGNTRRLVMFTDSLVDERD